MGLFPACRRSEERPNRFCVWIGFGERARRRQESRRAEDRSPRSRSVRPWQSLSPSRRAPPARRKQGATHNCRGGSGFPGRLWVPEIRREDHRWVRFANRKPGADRCATPCCHRRLRLPHSGPLPLPSWPLLLLLDNGRAPERNLDKSAARVSRRIRTNGTDQAFRRIGFL